MARKQNQIQAHCQKAIFLLLILVVANIASAHSSLDTNKQTSIITQPSIGLIIKYAAGIHWSVNPMVSKKLDFKIPVYSDGIFKSALQDVQGYVSAGANLGIGIRTTNNLILMGETGVVETEHSITYSISSVPSKNDFFYPFDSFGIGSLYAEPVEEFDFREMELNISTTIITMSLSIGKAWPFGILEPYFYGGPSMGFLANNRLSPSVDEYRQFLNQTTVLAPAPNQSKPKIITSGEPNLLLGLSATSGVNIFPLAYTSGFCTGFFLKAESKSYFMPVHNGGSDIKPLLTTGFQFSLGLRF